MAGLAGIAALTFATPAAAATTPAQAQSALVSDPVYVDKDAEAAPLIDAGKVRAAIGSSRIVVAVVPAADAGQTGGCSGWPQAIGGQRTVFVLCGYQPVAGSALLPAGRATSIVKGLGKPARTQDGYTGAVVSFVQQVQQQGSGGGSSNGSAGSSSSGSGSSAGGYVAGGILVAGAVGGIAYFRRRKTKRTADAMASSRAEIESLYSRLGSDVTSLDPKGDPVAQQAMTDAFERYTSAGGLRSRATTTGELAAVRDTLVEGLHATRAVRVQQGLDPGPPIPEAPDREMLTAAQQVQVGGQSYDGYPSYTPGAGNYFPGGTVGGSYVPGGWYRSRFWEGALLGGLAGTMLGGGFGGFGGFGMGYGSGYGSGYDSGYERGVDQGQDSGGGGGDWGGGGGDWGGGGGGDWGGGGGGDAGSW